MSFSLTILGSSSALPKPDRFTTAHVLNVHERFFLIDCGEGTQIQLRKFKIRFSKIHHIFISHLHGDHFFGLPGLISTFNLMGRKVPLTIFAPDGLEAIINHLHASMNEHLNYPLHFKTVDPTSSQVLLETKDLVVRSIPLDHKKETSGFLFSEKETERNIIKSCIEKYQLGIAEIVKLKKGEDVIREDGTVLISDDLTLPSHMPLSYAFVSDTRYTEEIVPLIRNVNLLYHEATYLDHLKERAQITGHSTAAQAAKIAKLSGARQLVLGHFSARYKDAEPLLDEAREIFPNTVLAFDGLRLDVDNSNEE